MDRGEHLQASHPPEPLHRTLWPLDRQVRILRPIVQPAAGFLPELDTELPHGGTRGPQVVSDEGFGLAMPLQRPPQASRCCLLVPRPGEAAFQHFAFMIDRSPEVVRHPVDRHEHLVQVPLPVTFLSPRLQQVLLEGRQPPGLTVAYLVREPLPLDWGEQQHRLATL